MTCPLCAAIKAGLPVMPDTPLPCRLRPTSHDPLPDDPFHGAVFDLPPGQKEFDPEVVRALNEHHASTTPEERVAEHAPHIDLARRQLGIMLAEHPLDALTKKEP